MELNDPALTFTLAMAGGIVAQAAARHLRIPGIVLLLLVGAVLGPEVANVVRPHTLGAGLDVLVGLSVAVILFEGGLNLSVRRLRREARVIRLLITRGAAITGVGAAVIVRIALGWPWPIAATFGALVIVTGPTVITPLLRRVRVRRNVGTILEAEGVLIDPIGAILAVVALELALSDTLGGAARGLLGLPSRFVTGVVIGAIGGSVIAGVLRFRKVVPEGLESVLTLSLVLALFEISDSIRPESGILAAAVAGLVVGNVGTRVSRELREFKEQLTVLLVGLLFVLLAADVRLEEVVSLGWAGVIVVAALMFVIRPLAVVASTRGSGLTWQERAFIAWLGPRGIVAAAVASVFAERLLRAGYDGGLEFRALVFLVIASTVVIQGFTSGPFATLLGVRRPTEQGHVIIGANALGRALGQALRSAGEDVVLIDQNASEAHAAEELGLRVIYGNANEERVLLRADVEGRRTFASVTTNESANILLARAAKENHKVPEALAAMEDDHTASGGDRALDERMDGHVGVLFGRPVDVEDWVHALRHGEAETQRWRLAATDESPESEAASGREGGHGALPLVLFRGGAGVPVSQATSFKVDDVVAFAVRRSATPLLPPGEWNRLESATDGGKET